MRSYLNQAWLVLLLAVALGTALAFVDQTLEGRIEQNARDRLDRAVFDVVSGGARSEEVMLGGRAAWRVYDEANNFRGWAVAAETLGFADRIRLLIGLSEDGSEILGVAVLDSRETPGLGERIREEAFLLQFAGRSAAVELQVVKPGESAEQSIDAISGATISSRAVTNAVNECVAGTRGQFVDAVTGAD